MNALREIWHYSQQKETTKVGTDLDHEMQNSMKLFRAQRNLYISGFALFLWLIIRRLVTLLTDLANARVGADAAMKQAASASEAAKRFMESRDVKDDNAKNVDLEELKEMKEKLAAAEKEAERSGKNLEAMKSQSESLKNEYDRLLGEYEKLEKKLETVRGSGDSSKKDE
ncbi:unnamed protein product [Darwinula stevensoni]|uniref:Endoplasmic reticulum transmembrane protein n=1 Tax=Darwinula stevensoni TaxID=69355 RepID=A0A7R9FNX4_9CRUS|nr:unnamed protein product [Darwinula stevensoni]CAG0897207.1 unnamed protein product [Darwinula stevensoni]